MDPGLLGQICWEVNRNTAPPNVENLIFTDDSLELCLWYIVKGNIL